MFSSNMVVGGGGGAEYWRHPFYESAHSTSLIFY